MVGLSVIGVSAPAFATGIVLLYVFAVELGWFPVFGPGEGFSDRLWHLALPAIALALTAMALLLKLTRAAMVTALDQDYVTFARARGLSQRRVIVAARARNALIPVVTSAGLIFGYMLTGACSSRSRSRCRGSGRSSSTPCNFRDIPMVQGLAMVVAVLIVLVNLVTDVLYLFLDPRIRFERVAAVSDRPTFLQPRRSAAARIGRVSRAARFRRRVSARSSCRGVPDRGVVVLAVARLADRSARPERSEPARSA